MLNYVRQFIEIRVFSTRFISETKTVTPIFFICLAQVTHYLTAVKKFKKIYRVESFRANVLKNLLSQ